MSFYSSKLELCYDNINNEQLVTRYYNGYGGSIPVSYPLPTEEQFSEITEVVYPILCKLYKRIKDMFEHGVKNSHFFVRDGYP